MARNDNSRMVVLFLSGLFVIAMAMIAVIYVSTRRPVVVVVPGETHASPGPPGSAPQTGGPGAEAAAPALPTVSVVKLDRVPTVDNPLDPAWDRIAAQDIPLQMQQTAAPMLTRATVSQVSLQAAYDDQRFVWRLSWEQATPSYKSNVGEFSDAVAVQFPLKDGAPYTMGGPDMPVAMMYWKALWQQDVDQGFQDVTNVYPNSWYDLYWFADETGPVPAKKLAEKPEALQYMPAAAAGNPMSNMHRQQPVEELTAVGFGSATDVPNSPVKARGVWKDGRWYVVFERPNTDVDPLIQRFMKTPQQQMLALAVWDGTAQNRGGRKHITNWIPMKIEP